MGELTKQYFTIAVSGSHGKSTTTAMIALILIEAGLDPTVVIGTKLKEFNNHALSGAEGSNFRMGNDKYFLIEADEWNASFLNYWPQIIVLTNIEREHLDYYRDLNHILKTFEEYVKHLPKDGILVANNDDINILKIKKQNPKIKIKDYNLKQKEAEDLKKILKVPGKHNISNALAALAVARILGISDEKTLKALSKYQGAWRRFEEKDLKVGNCKLKIINDYGHHPTEVKVTLKAAREKFPNKKIWCFFQPHQYQRTFNLINDFIKTFREAPIDQVIITDIYSVAGREKESIKKKINSQKLVKSIGKENVIYLKKEKIIDYLIKNVKDGEIIILMGAGDIYELNKKF